MAGALIERYRERLSLEPEDPVVSLHEGSTPLIEAPRLSERLGLRAYLKLEGLNPTGSFKDRGMTVAVSRAKGRGAEAVICASTGNTAASAAAYAARAGLRGAVIVPEGKIAIGKLAQALMHGARVIALRGNFDDALRIVRELAQKHPIELVNSVNPHRIEGQKTAAFEVVEDLGSAPDALAIPVGNAGNVTAYWRGFQECGAAPVLYGFQAEGAAPLVLGAPVEHPETVASAIRIGNPARWEEAMAAFTASRGRVAAVSDEQILDAYRWLAEAEGVFCEPASAASVAGLLAHGLPLAEGTARARVGGLRAHRPRAQGPRHGARQSAGRGQLRQRPRRGRAGGVRLTRSAGASVPGCLRASAARGIRGDRAASAGPRPGLLGEPRPRLRHARRGAGAAPRARGRGDGGVLPRPRRARGADRAREPARARLREPAPRGRHRLPPAQRDPARARARLQRGGDRRRAARRRPPLRAGALARAGAGARRASWRDTPTTSPRRSTADSSSAGRGRGARRAPPASTRPAAWRGSS